MPNQNPRFRRRHQDKLTARFGVILSKAAKVRLKKPFSSVIRRQVPRARARRAHQGPAAVAACRSLDVPAQRARRRVGDGEHGRVHRNEAMARDARATRTRLLSMERAPHAAKRRRPPRSRSRVDLSEDEGPRPPSSPELGRRHRISFEHHRRHGHRSVYSPWAHHPRPYFSRAAADPCGRPTGRR